MKVLLLKNVAKVGKKDEVKEVSDGYAHNFLFRQGLAVEANARTVQKVEADRAKVAHDEMVAREKFESILKQLQAKTITIHARANEMGHLYAALHAKELADEIKKVTEVFIPVAAILLPKPIKEVGEHTIKLAYAGVKDSIVVTISASKMV